MFGSNFFGQFGIPEMPAFPYQGADPQGGMLAPNAPVQSPMSQNDAGAGPATPIAGQPSPAGPAALGPSSPLSSASLGRQAAPQPNSAPEVNQQAPAAGIASGFGGPHG